MLFTTLRETFTRLRRSFKRLLGVSAILLIVVALVAMGAWITRPDTTGAAITWLVFAALACAWASLAAARVTVDNEDLGPALGSAALA
ncbi:MAG: hypothetical protein ABI200_05910, partial [Gaiellales bacterium]